MQTLSLILSKFTPGSIITLQIQDIIYTLTLAVLNVSQVLQGNNSKLIKTQ